MWNLAKRNNVNMERLNGEQRVLGGDEPKPKEYYFEQPLDHFDKSVNRTFGQRQVQYCSAVMKPSSRIFSHSFFARASPQLGVESKSVRLQVLGE